MLAGFAKIIISKPTIIQTSLSQMYVNGLMGVTVATMGEISNVRTTNYHWYMLIYYKYGTSSN